MYRTFFKENANINATEFINFVFKSSNVNFSLRFDGSECVFTLDENLFDLFYKKVSKYIKEVEENFQLPKKGLSTYDGLVIAKTKIDRRNYIKFLKLLYKLYEAPKVYSAVILENKSSTTMDKYNLFSINPNVIDEILNTLNEKNVEVQIAVLPYNALIDSIDVFSYANFINTLFRHYDIDSSFENKVYDIIDTYENLVKDQTNLMSKNNSFKKLLGNVNKVKIDKIRVEKNGDTIENFVLEINDSSLQNFNDKLTKHFYVSTEIVVASNGTVLGDYGFILVEDDEDKLRNKTPGFNKGGIYYYTQYDFEFLIANQPNVAGDSICTGNVPRIPQNLGVMKDKNYKSAYRQYQGVTIYNYLYGKVNQEHSIELYKEKIGEILKQNGGV